MSPLVGTILLLVLIALVVLVISRSIRIVPQATAGIVERFGRYHRTLNAGLNMVTPFVDRLRPLIDLREQVVSFPPQPVITRDNLVVGIDTVIYFQVTDARAATYEVANYITAVEQLTVTTLRNVVGGMELEHALTSRDQINSELRSELDEATGKWGIRVGRVELKAIEPPGSIQDSMEKQMRADRDKRAAILSAEGSKQSAILTAEGERQAAVLKARGESEATVLRAEAEATAQAARARGQAEAISTVFKAILRANVRDPDVDVDQEGRQEREHDAQRRSQRNVVPQEQAPQLRTDPIVGGVDHDHRSVKAPVAPMKVRRNAPATPTRANLNVVENQARSGLAPSICAASS